MRGERIRSATKGKNFRRGVAGDGRAGLSGPAADAPDPAGHDHWYRTESGSKVPIAEWPGERQEDHGTAINL